MAPKGLFTIIKETFQDWSADKASRLAASMAYYTLFSLAPLLVIVIAIIGFILGSQQTVQQRVVEQIGTLISPAAASAINGFINNARVHQGTSILSTILGVILLLVGASGVFGELQDALNTIWNVRVDSKRGFWRTVKDRFLSFTMVLGVGFLLLVSLLISTAISAVMKYFNNLLPGPGDALLLQGINIVLSLGIITLLFALIYKYLPDAEIRWRDVWMGSFVTALLFTIGKFAIGVYLGNSSTASVYGAAGSLVVILLWVYYSTQILFFGAEFTQVYARRHGDEIVPARGAVRMQEGERARVGLKPRPRRGPAQAEAALGTGAVPVTGEQRGSEATMETPTYHDDPQQDQSGLPPMPHAVKWLTRVSGALLGAVSLALAWRATHGHSTRERYLTEENRRLAARAHLQNKIIKNKR